MSITKWTWKTGAVCLHDESTGERFVIGRERTTKVNGNVAGGHVTHTTVKSKKGLAHVAALLSNAVESNPEARS